MAKITAPNKNYNGISAGVEFKNGEAECSDEFIIRWFRTHGYSVEENSGDNNGAVQGTNTETNAEANGEGKPGTSDAEETVFDGSKGTAEKKPPRREKKATGKGAK